MLCMSVMNYWEREHLDYAVQLESEFAQHTISGLWMFTDGTISEGDYEHEYDDVSHKPLKYYIRSQDRDSDGRSRGYRIMTVRGTTTWISFPWVRGQHDWLWNPGGAYDDSEGDECKEWFSDMGGETMDDEKVRKYLQLGS
jgi:hypothetical protein